MSHTRRWACFLLLGYSAAAKAAQTIPNPNSNRLGFPPVQTPPPPADGKAQRNLLSKQAHDQALQYAEDLLREAQELRDNLKKAGEYVVPLASIKQTERIEKLAKKIREQLKT